MSAYRVGQAVIGDVHHQVEVIPADGFHDNALCLPGPEARNTGGDDVGVTAVALEGSVMLVQMLSSLPPANQVLVHFKAQRLAAVKGDKT